MTRWLLPVVCAAVGPLGACRVDGSSTSVAAGPNATGPNADGQSAPGVNTALPVGVVASAAPASAAAFVHDPLNPPIDCPLRKHGIDPADPTHLRPFEAVEKYIAFLERADRAVWQKPDEVVAALGLRGDETVYDLGAGSGYFSFRIARALSSGGGKVVAGDTEAEMVRHIFHRAMTEGVTNVEAKLIPPADPQVPTGADVVFLCDVLHHVADRPAWLARLAAPLKPGTRLIVVEFKEGNLPEGPPEGLKLPRAQLLDLVTQAGFALDTERSDRTSPLAHRPTGDLLPYQVFLTFRRT